MLNQRDDLVRQNLSYQQELANLRARVMLDAFVASLACLRLVPRECIDLGQREGRTSLEDQRYRCTGKRSICPVTPRPTLLLVSDICPTTTLTLLTC